MDLARYKDGEALDFTLAAVMAKPWRRVALSASPETESYEKRAVVTRPARMGRLRAALDPGPTATLDGGNAIAVKLLYGGLQSVSTLALLNGANRVAIRARNGEWEIIGFRDAEEVDADVWHLTGLLRGLGGTEDATMAGSASGAPLVVLDSAATRLSLEGREAGLTLNWIAEAYGATGGRAGPIAFAGGMRAETPLAPVHLAARRTEAGDIALSWVRRSRLNADSWNGDDIPLDEAEEVYRLQILSGATVVRSLTVANHSFLYTQAQELEDFGASQSAITFRVRQKGATVALGIAAGRTVVL
jgi:hypothetical protein